MMADAIEKVAVGHNGLWEILKNLRFYVLITWMNSCRSKVPVRQNVRTQHRERTEVQTEDIVSTTFPENSNTQSQDFMDGIRYFKHFIHIYKR